MIIMSQELNAKQRVSEDNRPYATTATAKRFSSTTSIWFRIELHSFRIARLMKHDFIRFYKWNNTS
jgi:hypothetical protein